MNKIKTIKAILFKASNIHKYLLHTKAFRTFCVVFVQIRSKAGCQNKSINSIKDMPDHPNVIPIIPPTCPIKV